MMSNKEKLGYFFIGIGIGAMLTNVKWCDGKFGWVSCGGKIVPETKYDEFGNKIVRKRWEGSDVDGGFVDGYEIPENMDRLKFPIQVTTLPNTNYMGKSGMVMNIQRIAGDNERVMFSGVLPNGAEVSMPVQWSDIIKNTAIRNAKYFI
jgi:hypothetical protein